MIFNPDGKNKIPKDQDPISYLILQGALEVAGIDSLTGEFLYMITPKMKDFMPEVYENHIKTVNDELLALWEKGYVNIDFLLDDPIVTVSEKGLDKKELSKLTKQEIWAIEEIKRLLKK